MRTFLRTTLPAWMLAWSCLVAPAPAADDGFQSLFDGKTLQGWKGDSKLWSVQDGSIVGDTGEKKITKNTFLSYEKPYKNFVLKARFQMQSGNSGIQFRSKAFDEFVVRGYQADIASDRYTGILYEEGGRGILVDVKPDEVAKHLKKGDWNEYVITCKGSRITQQINGFTTVDYTEKDDVKGAKAGIIALQLHVGPPMKIRFKDIRIKELP